MPVSDPTPARMQYLEARRIAGSLETTIAAAHAVGGRDTVSRQEIVAKAFSAVVEKLRNSGWLPAAFQVISTSQLIALDLGEKLMTARGSQKMTVGDVLKMIDAARTERESFDAECSLCQQKLRNNPADGTVGGRLSDRGDAIPQGVPGVAPVAAAELESIAGSQAAVAAGSANALSGTAG